MNAMGLWNHPAFFGYCDRWMTPSHADSAEILAIKAFDTTWNFSADWEREGSCWDVITNDMWKTYRYSASIERPAANFPKANGEFRLHISATPFMAGFRGLKIDYSVGRPANLRIAVYDLSGRKIRELINGRVAAESFSIAWDGKDGHARAVRSGSYQLVAYINGLQLAKKIVMMR